MLIEVGGRELVMEKSKRGRTILHDVCECRASIEVSSKLIEIGGRELLLEKDNNGSYALFAFFEPLGCSNDGNKSTCSFFSFIAKEYISANVGGEFAVGGLFNTATDYVQKAIYDKWNKYFPSLQTAILDLQSLLPPILHAAIIAKAPRRIIANIANSFDCFSNKDSLGRNPIDVALAEGLEWSKGMQDVVEAMAAKKQCPAIHVFAKYGFPWNSHMRELINSNVEEVTNGIDNTTGLCVFMLAAMGKYSDLNVIYGLMKMGPYLSK